MAAVGLTRFRHARGSSADQAQFLAVGFVVPFAAAMVSVPSLPAYVKKYTLIPFGVQRIVVAGIFSGRVAIFDWQRKAHLPTIGPCERVLPARRQ
jgi:undecaprenyl pyrophosphate phosphatase UppP